MYMKHRKLIHCILQWCKESTKYLYSYFCHWSHICETGYRIRFFRLTLLEFLSKLPLSEGVYCLYIDLLRWTELFQDTSSPGACLEEDLRFILRVESIVAPSPQLFTPSNTYCQTHWRDRTCKAETLASDSLGGCFGGLQKPLGLAWVAS